MPALALSFLLGFGLSFIGSLPVGMINMAVARMAIKSGMKAALLFGFGAALVEFFQSYLAISLSAYFTDHPQIEVYIDFIALILFFALGVYYFFFDKPVISSNAPESILKKKSTFLKGMSLSSMNVLVFPYWIFYSTYLQSQGWVPFQGIDLLLFCTGVMAGALGVFYLFALMGKIILQKGSKLMRHFSKIIGLIMFVLCFLQLWKIL